MPYLCAEMKMYSIYVKWRAESPDSTVPPAASSKDRGSYCKLLQSGACQYSKTTWGKINLPQGWRSPSNPKYGLQ
jgi:hypothetical protein